MNSRERLLNAFRGEIPDRVPVGPMVNPGWLKRAGDRADEFIKTTDLMMDIWICSDIELSLGEEARHCVAKRTEGNRVVETIHTPKGDLTRVLSTDPNMLDWITKHFFEDKADVEKFLSVEYKPLHPNIEEFQTWDKRIGEEGLVMALVYNAACLPGFWMSPDAFMLTCIDDFSLIKTLLEVASERVNDYVATLRKLGVEHFRIAGAELSSQTLMGPGWFEKLCAPYDKTLVDVIHEHGGTAFYHCHGKIGAIIDQMAYLGIDALSPLEDVPQGDITLKEAKHRLGDKVCLMGNLDDMEFINRKSREEIEAKSMELIKDVGTRGRFVLGGTESGVYTEEILEGFLTMASVSEKYGTY